MEAAVVSALMTNIVARLFAVLEKRYDQLCALDDDINFLVEELEMIGAEMEDQLSQRGHTRAVQHTSMAVMRKLALDIEDCLDQFLPCAGCEEDPASIGDPARFAGEIQKLKKRLVAAHQQKTDYDVKGKQQVSAVAGLDDAGTPEDCHHLGIEKPRQEILDLLECKRERLMVISIVGFGGSGKTELAKAVYHCHQVQENFKRRAWAVASRHKDDIKGLLTAILQQLLPGEAPAKLQTEQVAELRQRLRGLLQDKSARCLIVIDDIEKQLWKEIERIFSVESRSRILVTTAINTVAKACSCDDGYIYNMRSFSVEDSKELLKKKVSFFRQSSPGSDEGSAAIVQKCDGHPLTLISVANHLQSEDKLTGPICKDTSSLLCCRMHEDKHGDFTKLQEVLMNNYSSLPGSSLKTCLLYTSLFPNNRPVRRKCLMSRWLAEGYIEGHHLRSDQEAAHANLNELIDRNIVQPIDASNNGMVKTCKPQGIVHQFMLHRSVSSNFIATSFGVKNRSKCRHLVIQSDGNGTRPSPATSSEDVQLRPRFLTVFGSAVDAIYSDLSNCKLLRVLDLKECHDFKEDHLKSIYKLLQLKYLTLGSSVSKLSRKIKNLHCLETLDLRKTKVETLPEEVIGLPHLAHLFGKIKLLKVGSKNRKNLNLQTLAGVVVDNHSGFPELMVHMKKLTRVKIWCEATSTHINYTLLSEAIQNFAKAGMNTPTGQRSLSLHLSDSSEDLLHCHQCNNTNTASRKLGYLTSLKLQGRPSEFRQFLMSLDGLEELRLTSGHLTGPVLSKLDTLQRLVCLKLAQVHLGDLDINLGDFPSLQRLCLVVQQPRFPTIQQGALPSLTSIQLLCEGLQDLCDIKIEWLTGLQEIALDSMVDQETIELWETEAKKHPKRPRVMLLKRVLDPAETGPSVKYVASRELDNNCYNDTCAAHHMAIDLDRLTLQQHTGSDQIQVGHKRPPPPHSPKRLIKSKVAIEQTQM